MNRRSIQGGHNPMNAKLAKGKKIELKRPGEERLKAAAIVTTTIDAMSIGVAITDLEGKILEANKTSYKMFGFKRDEGIGSPITDFIVKEDGPMALEAIQELTRKGYYRGFECTGVAKGRGKFPLLVDGAVTRDAEGNPSSIVLTCRDMTECKRTEEALRGSEERYQRLVETMNEGLEVLDENNLFIYANDRLCKMLEYSRDEIIGRPITDFVDKSNQNLLKEQRARRRKGERGSYELAWTGKDGQKIFTIISAVPILDADGRFKGSFAVVTDITERKRAEEERLKAAADKQRIEELERFAKVAVGRELKMVELKERIKELESKLKEITEKE